MVRQHQLPEHRRASVSTSFTGENETEQTQTIPYMRPMSRSARLEFIHFRVRSKKEVLKTSLPTSTLLFMEVVVAINIPEVTQTVTTMEEVMQVKMKSHTVK